MTALRQRMTEDMQVRNLSLNTQKSYLQQITRFARHFDKSPVLLGPEEIRSYQVYLTIEKELAPGSIQIAIAALRFVYRVTLKKDWSFDEVLPHPKAPQKLPIILSPEEVLHFLDCVKARKHRVILTVCYAAGLRISEAVRLKAAVIDSQRMVIRVEQGKGQKDRYVMLSPKLLEILRGYWRAVRPKDWFFPGMITSEEFIRRFLLHILPSGFQRIRYFGFLSNRHRATKLARCRELLGMPEPEAPAVENDDGDPDQDRTDTSPRPCPVCHHGHMIRIERLLPDATGPPIIDGS